MDKKSIGLILVIVVLGLVVFVLSSHENVDEGPSINKGISSYTDFEVDDLHTGSSISGKVYVSSIDGKRKLVIVADYQIDEKDHGPIIFRFGNDVHLDTLTGDHNGKFNEIYFRWAELRDSHELIVGDGYHYSGSYSATGTLVLTLDLDDSSNSSSSIEMGIGVGWIVNPDSSSKLSTHKTVCIKIEDQ